MRDVLLLWDGILEEYGELVDIPLSSGLSSACRTAQGLSKEYGGSVQVADHPCISVSLKSSALDAKALADTGCTAVEIKEELERTAICRPLHIAFRLWALHHEFPQLLFKLLAIVAVNHDLNRLA